MRISSVGFAAALISLAASAAAQEWKPITPGANLKGWTIRGGDATYEVKDGEVIGRTGKAKVNTFLCTEATYGDFELEFEFKVDPALNSGVQFRSEAKSEARDGRVFGYQAEIDPSPRAWTGGIYDEGRRGKYLKDLKDNEAARNAFKPNEWNKMWVSARGNTLRTRINGVDAVEVQDDTTSRGFIGLQVHATTSTMPLEVRWRNIRLMNWDKVNESHWTTDSPMGDYEGTTDGGKPLAAQVWDKGDGEFHARLLERFDSRKVLAEADGNLADGKVEFKTPAGTATIADGEITIRREGSESIELEKVSRKSPTEGAKPPAGATVLFDGTSLDNWQTVEGSPALWKIAENGAMEIVPNPKHLNHETKATFRDMELHLEFRTSFMPYARGQQRANSGVYIQGSYEVQVLDSYALEGVDNECGGIYKVGAPSVNMAYPPLSWQTYDISFKAAKWDGDKKTENARITVKHNGVTVQDNVELPDATGGAKYKGEPKDPAPLVLQDHGNRIQFRNIWVK